MSGLTSKYLEELGQKYCKNFLGVFPCNLHPNIEKSVIFSVIFNESKHDETGTHFVCVYAKKNDIFYFDSLGLKCENKYILKFLEKSQRNIIDVNKQIQSFDSIFCGYFCLSYILFMCLNKNLSSYFNMFNMENLKINDKIVTELIIKLLK